MRSLENAPYLSASVVVFHYEEALYQVFAPLPFMHLLWGCKRNTEMKTHFTVMWLLLC